MANKCEPVRIPATQGAAILDGLTDWTKIRAHRQTYLLQTMSGGGVPDWNAEFRRFTADRKNYTTALIVLSHGPYSALNAAETGLSEKDWLEASHVIRKRHECTHFLCRRLFPEKIDAIWDEVTADAVGLLSAFGEYRPALALRLLGIRDGQYIGGRLENYPPKDCSPEAWIPYCMAFADRISELAPRYVADAFALAVELEEHKEDIEAAIAGQGKETGHES